MNLATHIAVFTFNTLKNLSTYLGSLTHLLISKIPQLYVKSQTMSQFNLRRNHRDTDN